MQGLEDKYPELFELLKQKYPRIYQKKFHKFISKSYTTRNNLKNRTVLVNMNFDLSLEELRDMLQTALNSKCRYCNIDLTLENLCVDHIVPLAHGGDTTAHNLQIICKRCNTRKGSLSDKEYKLLLKLLKDNFKTETRDYIMAKLATRSYTSFRK